MEAVGHIPDLAGETMQSGMTWLKKAIKFTRRQGGITKHSQTCLPLAGEMSNLLYHKKCHNRLYLVTGVSGRQLNSNSRYSSQDVHVGQGNGEAGGQGERQAEQHPG